MLRRDLWLRREAMREALSELAEDEASPEIPTERVSENALPSEDPVGRIFTRGCPACESGMVAPGIRHNADCKRRNQHLGVRFSSASAVEPSDDRAVQQAPLPDTPAEASAPVSEGSAGIDDEEMPMIDPTEFGGDSEATGIDLRKKQSEALL